MTYTVSAFQAFDTITVYNRVDCCQCRISGAIVTVEAGAAPMQIYSSTFSGACQVKYTFLLTNIPVGQYQSQAGQSSCFFCSTAPAGTFQSAACNSTTNSVWTKCPAGQYQQQSGSSFCLMCPPGKYQSQAGQTNCLSCPTGSYSTGTAAAIACIDCPKGRYYLTQFA